MFSVSLGSGLQCWPFHLSMEPYCPRHFASIMSCVKPEGENQIKVKRYFCHENMMSLCKDTRKLTLFNFKDIHINIHESTVIYDIISLTRQFKSGICSF